MAQIAVYVGTNPEPGPRQRMSAEQAAALVRRREEERAAWVKREMGKA